MSWDEWSTAERQSFISLADSLLPGNGRLPSASAADIASYMSDAVRLCPDLEAPMRQLLERIDGERPGQERAALESIQDDPGFDALFTLATGAYCMSSAVWEVLGYVGQEDREVRDDTDTYVDLLMPVFERGSTYRPTPID